MDFEKISDNPVSGRNAESYVDKGYRISNYITKVDFC
jgi:hypothetical protein